LQAQIATVNGAVVDSISLQSLADATVSLLKFPGPDLIHRIRNRNGFKFGNLSEGDYCIITTYQGFAEDTFHFSIRSTDSAEIRHIISLHPTSTNLLQVVVRAAVPSLIAKNDTIAFNAAAYPSPPNSTLEDLLKKLPGILIDKDGHVTMNGQPVDKITIDGKDFFLGDPRLASQNLPADIVAQVEAFDSQSEKARLTGIKEQSNSKTINIKLKKNRNTGYFGKVYAGGGTDNGYSVGGSVTRLAGEQMLLLTGNANNINGQFTGTEHANGPGDGLQTTNNLQLNYRDAWSKKLTATINAGHIYNNTQIIQQLNRQTVLTDSSITQNSVSSTRTVNTNDNAAIYLQYAFDSLTEINFSSSYNHQQSKIDNADTVSIITQKPGINYLSSVGRTDNASNSSGDNIYNSLDFRRQFKKKGRLIYFNFSQNLSSQTQPASLYSLVRNFDSAENVLNNTVQNQQSTQATKSNNYIINASYTEPLGKRHILDFSYGLNKSTGKTDKKSFDFDSLTGRYEIQDSLTTNRFNNSTTVQTMSAGYNTTEGKYRFQAGLTAQFTQMSNLNLVNDSTLRQNTINWIPRASLLWQLSKGSNLNLSYSGHNTAPSTQQLQPIPDLTNPYLIYTGNPGLKQQLTHNLSVNYSAFNAKTFQNWQVSFNGNYAQNQITSASTVLAGGVQELEYVNVNGVFHLSTNMTYGFPINAEKNKNASISLHGQYGHDISLINGEENIAANTRIGGTANINFHVKDSLFVNLHAEIEQTQSNYSLPGSPTNQTLTEYYTADVSYRLPGSVTVATFYNLQVTGGQNNLRAQTVSLWNAAIYKSVFQNHFEIRVSAFDILNKSSAFTQDTGVNYVQTQKTNLPGRLLLLSLIWRFQNFGEQTQHSF
jgi:hypothetical protein